MPRVCWVIAILTLWEQEYLANDTDDFVLDYDMDQFVSCGWLKYVDQFHLSCIIQSVQ